MRFDSPCKEMTRDAARLPGNVYDIQEYTWESTLYGPARGKLVPVYGRIILYGRKR